MASGGGSPLQGVQIGDHNNQFNFFKLVIPVLTATIPGSLLVLTGISLAVVSFGGWMSIIFRLMASHGNITLPGPFLPSGIPLAACYFIGFAGGGIIAALGGSMATEKNKNRIRATVAHAVALLGAIVVIAYGVNHVAAGTPYRKLLPHFASCSWELSDNGPDLQHPPAFRAHVSIDEWVCDRAPRR